MREKWIRYRYPVAAGWALGVIMSNPSRPVMVGATLIVWAILFYAANHFITRKGKAK